MYRDFQQQMNRTFSEFYLWLKTEAPRDFPVNVENYQMDAFTQTWSNTACGFGGMAGNAIVDALTVVFRYGNLCIVFINARYAYYVHINEVENFREDLRDRKLAGAATRGNNYVTRYPKKPEFQ